MAVIKINNDPSSRELRWFGVIVGLFFGAAGAALRWRFDLPVAASITFGFGLLLAAVYYAVPVLRRRFYLAWMRVFYPLGWAVSHLVLAVIYYVLITPLGLALRLLGRDTIRRRPKRPVQTYWVKRPPNTTPRRYFRQS